LIELRRYYVSRLLIRLKDGAELDALLRRGARGSRQDYKKDKDNVGSLLHITFLYQVSFVV
jgi:hypothetical protein